MLNAQPFSTIVCTRSFLQSQMYMTHICEHIITNSLRRNTRLYLLHFKHTCRPSTRFLTHSFPLSAVIRRSVNNRICATGMCGHPKPCTALAITTSTQLTHISRDSTQLLTHTFNCMHLQQ